MADRSRLARLAPLALPPLAFLLYAATAPGLTRGDAAGVYATAAALVEHGRPAIDGAIGALAPAAHGADAGPAAYGPLAYAAGHFYHDAPPGPALLATPAYALGLALAPLLGPDAPALLVALLGPLVGALAVAGVPRLARRAGARGVATALLTLAGALLLWPLTAAPTAPLLAAALLLWLLPAILPLLFPRGATRGEAGNSPQDWGVGVAVGLGLGAYLLLDTGAGLLAMLALLALVVRSRRRPGRALALLLGVAVPALVLAAYGTAAFGEPWRLAFRYAVDPVARALPHAVRPLTLAALPIPLALLAAARIAPPRPPILGGAARREPGNSPQDWGGGGAIALSVVVAALGLLLGRGRVVLPLDWGAPGTALVALAVAAALAAGLALAGRGARRVRPGAAVPVAVLLCALVAGTLARGATAAPAAGGGDTNYLAPFGLSVDGQLKPLWTLNDVTRVTAGPQPGLDIGTRGSAISPWIDVTPGTAYHFEASLNGNGSGGLRVVFDWQDAERRPVVAQAWEPDEPAASGGRQVSATFAAPAGAAGLRLHLEATTGEVLVLDARLTVADGARVEPFPDYNRAALAFSFDWESAMGGLIHTRSVASDGEGPGGMLNGDGSPSVADAERLGLQMRQGAEFLATEFARYGIHATFYATGYDLLDGNPTCQQFLGDPIYKNVDKAHGWGSDYWATHPWYGNDPCTTEAQAPAWYFASETRALAAAGHEIASHTFGHLYVRGVTPAQLQADLQLWLQKAHQLGVPVAPSFAFPWTSSNSIDQPFYDVFTRLGFDVLTRLYQPLRHPFELDRVPGNPQLAIFPDQYLPSTPGSDAAAMAGIDEALARRGYFSLWTHPDEVLQQSGPVIWPRVIAYAAAQRDRGLWVAPVTQIADYSLATRRVSVTALPVAGGTRLLVENDSAQTLDGLTLTLSAPAARVTLDGRPLTDVRGTQVRLPALAPGARVVLVALR